MYSHRAWPIGSRQARSNSFGDISGSRCLHTQTSGADGARNRFQDLRRRASICRSGAGSGRAVAEAGAMMYMTPGIEMNTVFGDGSSTAESGGIMDKLLGAGKRLITGESLFMTVFSNIGNGKQQVAFAAPYAGRIIPMDLSSLGGTLICQKDSFLCAARGVSIGIAFSAKLAPGYSGVKALSCRSSKETEFVSFMPAEPSTIFNTRRGRRCAWIPDAS